MTSLLAQETPGLDLEVLIADGMSTDDTRARLAEWARQHPFIQIIDNPGKIVSTGLNAAIQEARGEFLLRMDMHTEYAPDYIRNCIAEIRRTGAESVGGPWQARGKGYISRAIAAIFQSPFGSGWARGHDLSYEGYVDTVYLWLLAENDAGAGGFIR